MGQNQGHGIRKSDGFGHLCMSGCVLNNLSRDQMGGTLQVISS